MSEQAAPDAPDNTEDEQAPDLVAEAEEQTAEEESDELEAVQEGDSELVRKLRREAKNYRTRLREAEEQIKQLTNAAEVAAATVEDYHRGEIERIASEADMLHPEDLWLKHQVQDFRGAGTEHGNGERVSEEQVKKVVAELRRSRPEWFKAWPHFPQGPQGLPPMAQRQTTFGEALKKAGAGRG